MPIGRGFLKRVLSGLVLIPLIVYIILYASEAWFFAAVSLITLAALWEFNTIGIVKEKNGLSAALGVFFGISILPLFYFCSKEAVAPALIAAVFILFANGFRADEFKDGALDALYRTGGIIYIALPFSFFLLLRQQPSGQWWAMFLLVVIWANDSFALFAGKTLGRHKMTPRLSPNKTIEGLIGGLAGCVVTGALLSRVFGFEEPLYEIAMVSLAIGLIATVGDLAESLLKRAAGVKDSGTLIPGHGGMLDRIDSVIFCVPALYYYLIWQ